MRSIMEATLDKLEPGPCEDVIYSETPTLKLLVVSDATLQSLRHLFPDSLILGALSLLDSNSGDFSSFSVYRTVRPTKGFMKCLSLQIHIGKWAYSICRPRLERRVVHRTSRAWRWETSILLLYRLFPRGALLSKLFTCMHASISRTKF